MGERRWQWTLVLAVGALALLLATGGGVVAGTAAAATAPTDACAGVGNETVVVATPPGDDPIGPGETVPVYAGSEVVLDLCQPPNGTRTLDPGQLPWATVVEASTHRVRLRVQTAPNASLGALTAGSAVPGPDLRIVGGAVESDLVAGPITVGVANRAAVLDRAETAFLERERALEDRIETLANRTAAVENGSHPNATALRRVLAADRAYANATAALQAELYAVADSPVGGAQAATALGALERRSTAAENRTRATIEDHGDALRQRERSATWALRLRVVGLGALGLVLGALAGALLPTRRGRAARRRLAVGEWTTYSRRAVLLPALVAVVLCCLGLAWLALGVGDALLEVMVP